MINVKIKILLIILVTSSLSIAQNTVSLKSLKNNAPLNNSLVKDSNNNISKIYFNINYIDSDLSKKKSENNSEDYRSSISAGIGFTHLTKSQNKTEFLFSLEALLNIKSLTKYFFLGLGTHVFQEPGGGTDTRTTFYIIPTFGKNFGNKLSLYFGAGYYIYVFPITGSVISFKADYNISKKFAVGFSIKRPDFGDQEFSNSTLLISHLFISFKL
jgi:hypothetical protein